MQAFVDVVVEAAVEVRNCLKIGWGYSWVRDGWRDGGTFVAWRRDVKEKDCFLSVAGFHHRTLPLSYA